MSGDLKKKINEIRSSGVRLTSWQNNFIDAVEDRLKLAMKITSEQFESVIEIHKQIKGN